MQIIALIHHCLYFKFNKKKFLFGLTLTLSLDPSAIKKLKIDYIILPSHPYNQSNSIFLWHLELISQLKCTQILVPDNNTKKRIQYIIEDSKTQHIHIEFLNQFNLNQEQLFKCFEQIDNKNKNQRKLIQFYEPNGLGFNQSGQNLNIIISQEGRGIILVHQCSTILIDPSQKIIELLNNYGIPQNSIKLILLTSSNNLNIFQIMIKYKNIKIITQENIYKQLKNRLKIYLLFNNQMLRQKIKGRILYQPHKKHRYFNFQFSFQKDKQGQILFWDIHFGMKIIRIYHTQISLYPMEIINNSTIQFIIAYNIHSNIKKQLQTSPQVYRKKIIFNRISKKYGNKYFYNVNKGNQCISVVSHAFLKQMLKNNVEDVSFLFNRLQINGKLQHRILKDKQSFNTNQMIVYVRKGYVRDDKGQLKVFPNQLIDTKYVIGEGNSLIMYEQKQKCQFYEKWKILNISKQIKHDDILKKVQQNSFISTLKKNIHKESNEIIKKEDEQFIQEGSQWQLFRSICKMKTFQAGCQMQNTHNLYIIVKGCMRYKKQENVMANRNTLIGNQKYYYWNGYDQCQQIEVVKDTWALEIPFSKLQKIFFNKYPQRFYDLFTLPTSFQ